MALRGDGKEDNGNFMQLLKVKAEDDSRLLDWLEKKLNKYTSHDIQNEILKVMSVHLLREIATSLQLSSFITIMMDETTDVSNKQQATIVFRLVTDEFAVHEEFLGMYEMPNITSCALVGVMKDALYGMNISISKVCGQCYDGASTMRGARNGVAKLIMDMAILLILQLMML